MEGGQKTLGTNGEGSRNRREEATLKSGVQEGKGTTNSSKSRSIRATARGRGEAGVTKRGV